MSSFTTPLKAEFTGRGKRPWVLVEPFVYEVGHIGSGQKICVPEGFTTDGASIPKPFSCIIDPWGREGKAAVLHDYLYWVGVPRRYADNLFREAMGVLGVKAALRFIIWAAVRLFGGWRYRQLRRNQGRAAT